MSTTTANMTTANKSSKQPSGQSSMAAKREEYLKHLLTQSAKAAKASGLGLETLRERAIALTSERSFPSNKDEEWRFTDLSEMLGLPFQVSAAKETSEETSEDALDALKSKLIVLEDSYRLVTVNGHYMPELSVAGRDVVAPELPDGAMIGPLSELLSHPTDGDLVKATLTDKIAQIQGNGEVFTALNTTGFSDVMVVWIRSDQTINAPIHIARVATGEGVSHLRTLVIAERHAKFTLVETFCSDDDQTRFNNNVSELWLSEGAQVTHARLQDEGEQTFHISKTAISQAENSTYHSTSIDLGGRLARHHHEMYQAGPQTETHLYGLSALGDSQLADTHSLIALTHPHSRATQVQKNVVDDRAHSVFNGKVYVSQAAQHTDAAQLNRNLMISDKARVDTKPELDIVADNVKCAHGATVSQLQADEVFYLQSRGISATQAQRLLLYGFAMEIVEKISVSSLRQRLSDRISKWAR
ncbi:MAG: Fe-S cluster assembly protein SufD [Phormidesmis sp.]